MMILRSLTPLIGLVTLAVADTPSSPNSTAQEVCQDNLACNLQYENSGRMVLSHLWQPNATTGASDSWDISRLWHARCDGSERKEYCDARVYNNMTARVVYHHIATAITRTWNYHYLIDEEQTRTLLDNIKSYIGKANADGTLIDTSVREILAEAGYKEMLRDYMVEIAELLLIGYTEIEALEKLKENLGDSKLVEPFLQEAWAKDGTCIGALSTSCYSDDTGVVAYVDRLATSVDGTETYKRLAEKHIVPSDSKLYSLEDIEAAIRRNRVHTGATFVCSNDTLVEIKYYWKVKGHFDQSTFLVADPQFKEPGNCPEKVRYPPKVNFPALS